MMPCMPEPVTVWMVELGVGAAEVRGSLSLEDDGVVFTRDGSGARSRFAFEDVRGAKRVRGSPILLLAHRGDEGARKIAFYFSQPPPLEPPEPGAPPPPGMGLTSRPSGAFGAVRRTSKRRHMRSNMGYLTSSNAGKKGLIESWAAEIGVRVGERG
jgi:hypothetical protein